MRFVLLALVVICSTGGTMVQPDGYLATPPSGKGPGVLVIHPWWGLNKTIKGMCDRLAKEGYVVFAPDLYHGKVATTIADAESLSGKLESAKAKADVDAGEAFLLAQPGRTGEKIGVVGFSLGGSYAYDLSAREPEHVRAVVVFYGSSDADFSRSKATYMGHYAEKDPYEGEWVGVTKDHLTKGGRPFSFYTYDGTGHWFVEPDRKDAYKKVAAELAWKRTFDFLKREL